MVSLEYFVVKLRNSSRFLPTVDFAQQGTERTAAFSGGAAFIVQ